MMFVARPAAVFGILSSFKIPFKEKLFVSWVGLRGAAAIVFAIMAITQASALKNDVFHIVFFVALFSGAVQGTLTPLFAKSWGWWRRTIPYSKPLRTIRMRRRCTLSK